MKQEGMRTEGDIYGLMRAIIQAWNAVNEKKPEDWIGLQASLESQLGVLYWVIGYDMAEAQDMASVALGGDPIDRS